MSQNEAKIIATLPRNDREELRVAIAVFKGRTRVDIRVWLTELRAALDDAESAVEAA